MNDDDRPTIALFIALTATRSPELMKTVLAQHLSRLPQEERVEMDRVVGLWCEHIEKDLGSNSHREFLKSTGFDVIWLKTLTFQKHLLEGQWHLLNTTRDQPFVTSDRPVVADWYRQHGMRVISCPISSEFALLSISGGEPNGAVPSDEHAANINNRTIRGASEFIAACKEVPLNLK